MLPLLFMFWSWARMQCITMLVIIFSFSEWTRWEEKWPYRRLNLHR
jgi:hypothetical protein